jgi:transcriptional regulator with XRE-family HTH domain
MAGNDAPTFGDVLRRFRRAEELTQEELAERATLSARAISDLERGLKRAPRRDAVRLLSDALEQSGEDRSLFERAGHPPRIAVAPGLAEGPQSLPAFLTIFVGKEQHTATIRNLLLRQEVRRL